MCYQIRARPYVQRSETKVSCAALGVDALRARRAALRVGVGPAVTAATFPFAALFPFPLSLRIPLPLSSSSARFACLEFAPGDVKHVAAKGGAS